MHPSYSNFLADSVDLCHFDATYVCLCLRACEKMENFSNKFSTEWDENWKLSGCGMQTERNIN